MSDGGTNHSGWGSSGHSPVTASILRQLGSPGKYHSVVRVAADTTQSFNSSSANYGYGAVMLGDGAAIAGTSIDLLGGGRIFGNDLAKEVIYEFAVSSVQAKTDDVYVFKVQR